MWNKKLFRKAVTCWSVVDELTTSNLRQDSAISAAQMFDVFFSTEYVLETGTSAAFFVFQFILLLTSSRSTPLSLAACIQNSLPGANI